MSKLKPKSKEVLDTILANPKISHTDAYLKVHKTTNRNAANANVHKLLAKPSAILYLEEHLDKAKQRIVSLVDSNREEIALKASESIINRELGLPTARQEIKSTRINISLGDLTEVIPHPLPHEDSP